MRTLCLLALALALRAETGLLLIDKAELDAARRKAQTQPWARAALERIVSGATRALKTPIEIPNRGGQWPHWYSCKRDGVRLTTVSPTEHRCPKCGAVYHGEPYDSVVLYGVHSSYSRAVRDLGLAYQFTSRAEFAKRAGEILTGYAQRYRGYRLHTTRDEEKVGGGRIMSQTLDESVWLIPATWGYAMVRDTLTPEQRRKIEEDLLLPAADVIRSHKLPIHNIQCWKNSAVGVVGFVTGRQDLIKEAIDDPDRGFRAQIARGVTDDGLWYEGSMGYHQYTMQALWPLAEAARHAGIDLYSDRYRKLYEAPLALALPDGSAPGFNDNSGGNVQNSASLYELAFTRWKTPAFGQLVARGNRENLEALLYGAENPPAGSMIPTTSVMLGSAGFAMLRSPSVAIAERFGMHGGGHGHPDKLNIVTFGAGKLWGVDPGSINYGVPLHQEWYRSTIAHNTISVDEKKQANADGKLERWDVKPGGTILAASANSVYPGVSLSRTVTLRGNRAEDRFECRSAAEHVYDWAFHSAGKATTSLKLERRDGPLGSTNGYQHIENVSSARTDAAFWVRWEQDGATLTMKFEGAPGTEVFLGEAPGRNPAVKVPALIVRRRGREAVFQAVHEYQP